jgi:hypothetical protein
LILSCALFTRHDHVLNFLSIYFETNIITTTNKSLLSLNVLYFASRKLTPDSSDVQLVP